MVKYRVPEQFKHGFVVISGLSSVQVKTLCGGIEKATSAFSADSLVSQVNGQVDISHEDLRSLIHTIFSLTNFIVDDQIAIEELATDMADSYADVDENFTEDKKEKFKKNLVEIVNSTSRIRLIIKARRLTTDYDKVFSESRVLSDIRFVLGDDIKNKSQSAVIVHQLKIDYSQNGEMKQDFFAMDINDLRKLKASIDRALEKEEKIRSKQYFDNLMFLELSS